MPTYRPATTYFWAGILLCFTVGIVAAGVYESWLAEDWGWTVTFLVGELGCLILYFWIVASWVNWSHLSGDFEPDEADVGCSREHNDQHPGDR
jgi:hypothetical protein